jgi:hypothetical protein
LQPSHQLVQVALERLFVNIQTDEKRSSLGMADLRVNGFTSDFECGDGPDGTNPRCNRRSAVLLTRSHRVEPTEIRRDVDPCREYIVITALEVT